MKVTTFTLLFTALVALSTLRPALAAPEEGTVSRFGLEATSWQEQLRLQDQAGNTDLSVANYKGWLISYERQWRYKTSAGNGAYGLGLFAGQGQASGGGTSDSFDYRKGSLPWTIAGLEPRIIWVFSEVVDLGIGLAATYRSAQWEDSATTKATATRSINAVFFFDLDVSLSAHLGLKQSIGLNSTDVGPMFRWGLTYDL